jgi:hypothetical protein
MSDALALYKTGEAIGLRPWSDEFLGKLLAFAAATGFPEFTVGRPMQDVLMVAAYRFGLEGGRVPDVALMNKCYYPRLRELTQLGAKTPWLPAVAERYGITDWSRLEYEPDFTSRKARKGPTMPLQALLPLDVPQRPPKEGA